MSRTIGAALAGATLVVLAGWGSSSPALAVIEQIYTLPFEGQYSVYTWFCGYSGHEGTDYVLGEAASGGHPVLAAGGGSVWLYEQFPSGAGYYVVMNHGNGHRTRYLHLSSRVVANGQVVARGQTIGYEGMTGDDDNHLHFETRHGPADLAWPHPKNGTAVDPYSSHCTSGTYMWKTNPPSMGREMEWSGDGYADVLARKPNGELCLFAGNGNSGWNAYPDPPCGDGLLIGTGWQVFDWLLRPGDWSGDGCHDVLARAPTGVLYLYYGNCATGFIGSSGVAIGSGWQAFDWLLGPGDYTGDGFNDVLARRPNGEMCLFRGDGQGGWISYPDAPCGDGLSIATGTGYFVGLVAPSDFGGGVTGACADTVGDTSSGSLRIRYGGCNETWGSEATIGAGWQDYEAMLGVGDFGGDVCLDILARKYTGAPDFYLFRGNCAGGFGTYSGIGTGWWGFDKLF